MTHIETNDKYLLNANSYDCIDALTHAFICVERDQYMTDDQKRNTLSTLRAIILQRGCLNNKCEHDQLTTSMDIIIFG
jgi:hypothetical protein